MFLTDLSAELNRRNRRTYFERKGATQHTADSFLNVWSDPSDRYPAQTIYWDYSRATGGKFLWGDKFQYSAPWTGIDNIGLVADLVEETL